MDPRRKPGQQGDQELRDEAPALEQQDWDAVETGTVLPDSLPEDLAPGPDSAAAGDVSEDDDNPYQNSDEALPEDGEEAVIARDPSREGGRFDEI